MFLSGPIRCRIKRDRRIPDDLKAFHSAAVVPHARSYDTAGSSNSAHLARSLTGIRDEANH
jgi:hypothetical protein